MFLPWLIFHVIVCIALVLVVLMQSSKGEGLAGSAFGGGGGGGISGAVFGGRGAASFLSRATTVLAVLFMLNCVGLAYLSAGSRVSMSSGSSPSDVESVVTQKAQEERDRAMERQAQQVEQIPVTGDSTDVNLDEIIGGDSDSAAGGGQ